MNEFYTVKEVAIMSGLTERTIRHYIQTGILKGSKTDGIWKFTPEEVDAFFEHPSVFPGIQSKRNGIVSEFLVNRSRFQNRICAILDLPKEDRNKVSGLFCDIFNHGNYGKNLEFYYEDFEGCPRIILTGSLNNVLAVMNQYQALSDSEVDRDEI